MALNLWFQNIDLIFRINADELYFKKPFQALFK
jgi:hypothetical protein